MTAGFLSAQKQLCAPTTEKCVAFGRCLTCLTLKCKGGADDLRRMQFRAGPWGPPLVAKSSEFPESRVEQFVGGYSVVPKADTARRPRLGALILLGSFGCGSKLG